MLKKLFFFALLFRLIIAPFSAHSDVYDQLNWGKDLISRGVSGFYSRDIPDAGPPNYPPLYFLITFMNENVYEFLRNIFWKINTIITIFPSGLYLWFEGTGGKIFFNKLIPIFCDLGIGWVIYLFIAKLAEKNTANAAASLYLFLPPSWYISSVWGQTDSLYIFPLIFGLYNLLVIKNYVWAIPLFAISFLVKPTVIFCLPIFLFFLTKGKLSQMLVGIVITLFIVVFSHLPFGISLSLEKLIYFYTHSVREISGYISSNAFNLWGITHGFGPISDSVTWFHIPALYWGIIISCLFSLYFIYILYKTKKLEVQILVSTLFTFQLFLFLTRMHERYFYLTFIWLILSIFALKLKKWILYLSTFAFTVNLYHYWWVPGGEILKYILSNRMIEIIFCLTNIFLFFYLERIREKIRLNEK